MQQTKQITEYALHTFLEKIEAAILDGYSLYKSNSTYAKLIGGRYVVTVVKAEPVAVEMPEQPQVVQQTPQEDVPVKPSTRKTTKKVEANE